MNNLASITELGSRGGYRHDVKRERCSGTYVSIHDLPTIHQDASDISRAHLVCDHGSWCALPSRTLTEVLFCLEL